MNIIRSIQNGVEFFTVQETGESGMSVSGLARLCGISHQAITKLLNEGLATRNLPESLKPLLGMALTLTTKSDIHNVSVIRDEVCACVIEYYAFDSRKTTDEARYAYRKFARDGIRGWIQQINKWQLQQPTIKAPHHYRRLQLFKMRTKMPVGYWCIFEELTGFVGELEAQGYLLPHSIIPDISVGKCWCNYLRSLGYEPKDLVMKYDHYYPDRKYPVKANIYPNELLGMFKTWFEATYKPQKALQYFRKADQEALPSLCKLLGLPEAQ